MGKRLTPKKTTLNLSKFSQLFPKPKDKLEKHQIKSVIYSIPCKDYEKKHASDKQNGNSKHKRALSIRRITTPAIAEHSFKIDNYYLYSIITCNP